MVEDNKNSTFKKVILYIFLFLSDLIVLAVGDFFYGMPDLALLRLLAFLFCADIIVVFTFNCGEFYDSLFVKNRNNKTLFYVIFILSGLFSLIFPLMPIASWPIVVIFVLLTLVSNVPTGIVSSVVCLVIAASMTGLEKAPFYLTYFICGLVAIILLSNMDEEFKIGFPLFITEILLVSGLIIVCVTFDAEVYAEVFIYPVINAAITFLLLLLVLKVYSNRVIFSEADKYLEINDPECQILSELKGCSPDDYYKSVHVAYFCDRIAKQLELNNNAVKCAGFYHRIGAIGGKRNWENTKMICDEQNMPEEVMTILKQMLDTNEEIKSPETAVLYMSECIVSSIKYLFNKNKDITLDYPTLIDAIFKQRIETGVFSNCNISIKQFEDMKNVFIEEKLYYDFLR